MTILLVSYSEVMYVIFVVQFTFCILNKRFFQSWKCRQSLYIFEFLIMILGIVNVTDKTVSYIRKIVFVVVANTKKRKLIL